jgi:outer membrane protein assembly factor BamB
VAATVALSGCWLQPGFDPHRSGHNDLEAGLTEANVATLTEAWSVTVGAGPVDAPVVSRFGVHASSDTFLASYRLSDGAESWRVDVSPAEGLPGYPDSPRVRGDELRVPISVPFRAASHTFAFDARTGASVAGATPYGLVTVDDDTLIGTERRIIGTGFIVDFLHSTNLTDPSQSWDVVYDGGNHESAVSDQWIVTVDDVAVVGAFPRSGPNPELCVPEGGWVLCGPAWQRTLGGGTTAPVVADDGRTVYVGDSAGTIWALDIADGSVRWSAGLGAGVLATPTVGDGTLFVSTADGRLSAFDADGCGGATCAPSWTTAATGAAIRQQAALAGGVVYVASEDGSIRAFDASGCGAAVCDPLWQTSTGSHITGAPAVARGHLVVGTQDGRLIAYAPAG